MVPRRGSTDQQRNRQRGLLRQLIQPPGPQRRRLAIRAGASGADHHQRGTDGQVPVGGRGFQGTHRVAVGRTMHLPAALPGPALGQQLLPRIEGKAMAALVGGLPDVEAGPDSGDLPMVRRGGSEQERATLKGCRHRQHSPENHQLLLTEVQRPWRFGHMTQYFVHLPTPQPGIVMTDSSSDVLEHTSTTLPGSDADDAGPDVSFSERYSEIIGKVNATLDQVDWSQMGRISKAVGVIVAVIVAQVLIKGVLDTINLLPVIPGLLELLGLVVVGQWGLRNLTTSEKRQKLTSQVQNLRKEYLG